MIATRVIPCLLLRGQGFVKTVRFQKPTYLGDPVNIVRIFNDKEVDELFIADIEATPTQREPNFELLNKITTECFIPVTYAGGVTTLDQMKRLFAIGIEKVALNSITFKTPELIDQAAAVFGSQSVVVVIDVKKTLFGKYVACTHSGRSRTGADPLAHAKMAVARGAGEIVLNSIDRDGTGQGYDLPLIRSVSSHLSIPVIACGGAASTDDLRAAVVDGGASAAAAGSMFVFHGTQRAVLISYPDQETLHHLFSTV